MARGVVDVNTDPPVYFFRSVYLCRNMRVRIIPPACSCFVSQTGNLIQKAKRFAGATPPLAHHPMSPRISVARNRLQLERPHGCDTLVVLAFEEGSVTTFMVVHQHVKADCPLDALHGPRISIIGSCGTPSIDPRLMA